MELVAPVVIQVIISQVVPAHHVLQSATVQHVQMDLLAPPAIRDMQLTVVPVFSVLHIVSHAQMEELHVPLAVQDTILTQVLAHHVLQTVSHAQILQLVLAAHQAIIS
jgi:hypothetical protein